MNCLKRSSEFVSEHRGVCESLKRLGKNHSAKASKSLHNVRHGCCNILLRGCSYRQFLSFISTTGISCRSMVSLFNGTAITKIYYLHDGNICTYSYRLLFRCGCDDCRPPTLSSIKIRNVGF